MSRKNTHVTAAARALYTALAVAGAGFTEDTVRYLDAGTDADTQTKETRNALTNHVDCARRSTSVRPARPGRA